MRVLNIILNGKAVTAREGQTILELAQENGVFIPTLCHSPALEPAAMCRLCTVQVIEGGRPKFVTACNFPLRRDAEIRTDSPEVRHGRKLIIELLMARCPSSPELQRLAIEYEADLTRFSSLNDDCVVCGLCTRACETVTGKTLSLAGRGTAIHVSTAFAKISDFCIGCGACVQICPVQKISMEDVDGERHILLHGKIVSRVKLPRCKSCGKYFGPVIDLKKVMEQMGEHLIPPPNADTCPECSRHNLAVKLGKRYFEQYGVFGEEGQADAG